MGWRTIAAGGVLLWEEEWVAVCAWEGDGLLCVAVKVSWVSRIAGGVLGGVLRVSPCGNLGGSSWQVCLSVGRGLFFLFGSSQSLHMRLEMKILPDLVIIG